MIHLVMWRLTASASQYSDWLEILTFLCFPSVQNRFKNFESSTSFFKMGPASMELSLEHIETLLPSSFS